MLFVCPEGAEALLSAELRAFGATSLRPGRAQVRLEDAATDEEAGIGGLRVALQACLSSHVCSRVLWPIARFAAHDPRSLYEGARAIAWNRFVSPQKTFAVRTRRGEGELGHGPYVAQVVKDALVDQVRDACGERPNVERQAPDVLVQVVVHRGEVELLLDLSGDSLHERGAREQGGAAPLKEHVAAIVLLQAGWPALAATGAPLIDPMCGSGTLLVEAALMARGMPPRAKRRRFGVDGIDLIPRALWQGLREQAQARFEEGRALPRPAPLFGLDAAPEQVARARRALVRIGLEGDATLLCADVKDGVPDKLRPLAPLGLIVANTPYGERIGGDRAMVEARLSALGAWLKQFSGWRASLLVGEREVGFSLGLRAHKMHALRNGPLHVTLLHIAIAAGAVADTNAQPPAQDFARRVEKNERHRKKLAEREQMGAYRVYDADVPEYRAAIDVYDSVDGERHVYMQPYRAPSSVDERKAQMRVRHMLLALPQALGVEPERVTTTERTRQRASQYGHKQHEPTFFWIRERGMSFCVSLDAYVDTGLYLDLRNLRAYVRDNARGKRVLNLFGYTGSMSVAAATGGAASTVTVDRSNAYLDWAHENFRANHLDLDRHQLVRADVLPYLNQMQDTDDRFDLIYIGAPTFSSGKMGHGRMQFDVTDDHAQMLRLAMSVLRKGGECWFSSHRKGFRLDESVSEIASIEEKTEAMCPPDFVARRPYRLWRLRHLPA